MTLRSPLVGLAARPRLRDPERGVLGPDRFLAMVEGPLLLSMLVRAFRFELVPDRPAMPVAHLTVRGQDGIWLKITPRTVG